MTQSDTSPLFDPQRSDPQRSDPQRSDPQRSDPKWSDPADHRHVVVLAGGVGGSRFVRGVRQAYPHAHIDVIANTADDITLHGLRICPDLDTMMYALGNGIDEEKGWGRQDEGWLIGEELAAYDVHPRWFNLGDRDIATHLVRTELLNAGYRSTEVAAALCTRWFAHDPRLRLLPMTDERVETHIVIDDPDSPSGQRAVHFQEYWVRLRAAAPVRQVLHVGIEHASMTAEVSEAIARADLILVAPSNPVVSIGPILATPGVRQAIRSASAKVVGFSGILQGAPVLGMADKLLPAIGVEVDAAAVAEHYGWRGKPAGILDAWVMDSTDADRVERVRRVGLRCDAVPLLMKTPAATAEFIIRGAAL